MTPEKNQPNNRISLGVQTNLKQKNKTNLIETSPDNPYMMKPSMNDIADKKRHSISYKVDPINEEKNKPKTAFSKMRQLVARVITDEEFINKEFPAFKLEKILKPGESYGEVGMEFILKKSLFISLIY